MKRSLGLFTFLIFSYLITNAQSFVNEEWSQAYGLPDSIDWMQTCLDVNDNIME